MKNIFNLFKKKSATQTTISSSKALKAKRLELENAELDDDRSKVLELIQDKQLLDVPDREGRTILWYAASKGWTDVVKELIKNGADLNYQDKEGWTALHAAAQDYQPETAALVLKAGAKVDMLEVYGNTPLSTAVYNSKNGTKKEMIQLFLKFGADKNKKNKFGVSPGSLAETMGFKI